MEKYKTLGNKTTRPQASGQLDNNKIGNNKHLVGSFVLKESLDLFVVADKVPIHSIQ